MKVYSKKWGIICLLAFVVTVTGCSKTVEEETVTEVATETVSEAEKEKVEPEAEEKEVVIEGEVVYYNGFVCEKPVLKTLFTNEEEWIEAVDNTDIQELKDRKSRYTSEFFEQKSLYYYPMVVSAGMQYKFEDAVVQEAEGKKVLTIYASYTTETMLNTQSGYGFFVELDKEAAEGIEEALLEQWER